MSGEKKLRTMVRCQDGTQTNVLWWDEIRLATPTVLFVNPPEGDAQTQADGFLTDAEDRQEIGTCVDEAGAKALYEAIMQAIQYKADSFDVWQWSADNGILLQSDQKDGTTGE